ncbi:MULTISPECIES: hypothetical protein [Bifidobacterium]|uniref:hypothetical protein n=1 Tax=Bifidobacterium TaxID=1678 RepID=UPI001BDC60DB|nr:MULTISPECIES: hypothetical protein [Bifidobacterium]MBT1162322.1 hypothetical protein [Bifidobacterium sp. SO1]MBW3078826.1 hypothetical protein [Bifidobacterium simiiventris]
MTDLNNSNGGELPDQSPNSNPDGGDIDSAWAAFAEAHADDLKDVEHSRSAKRFEKHAQRKEKEALLSVGDLDNGVFVDDPVPLNRRGPRDNTRSSWLDTDNVMDRYGDDFVPPNPEIGPVKASKLVFWVLLVAGIIGLIASVFVPALAAMLGTIFGVCALVGAAGLIVQHKGHTETRNGYTDDGARV